MLEVTIGCLVMWIGCDRETVPETKAVASKTEAKVVDTKMVDTKMVDTKVVDTKAVVTKVVEAKAVDAGSSTATPGGESEPEPKKSDEQLGGLRLGMTMVELRAVVPALASDGTVTEITPDSLTPGPRTFYSQTFKAADVVVTVESRTKDGVQRAAGISAESPAATTSQGIALGATRKAVKKAYPKAFAPIKGDPDEWWVPLDEDEMLFLAFEEGKLQDISLGKPMDPKDLEE